MQIENIVLDDKVGLADYQGVVAECQKIIEENLQRNGGMLKQSNLFSRNDLIWKNLIVARVDGKVVGFLLIRLGQGNEHGLKNPSPDKDHFYYYISEIVVKEEYRRQHIGSDLLKVALSSECRGEFPLVASVLVNNTASQALLSSGGMKPYGQSPSGRYIRLVDGESYKKIYNPHSLGEVPQSSSRKRH